MQWNNSSLDLEYDISKDLIKPWNFKPNLTIDKGTFQIPWLFLMSLLLLDVGLSSHIFISFDFERIVWALRYSYNDWTNYYSAIWSKPGCFYWNHAQHTIYHKQFFKWMSRILVVHVSVVCKIITYLDVYLVNCHNTTANITMIWSVFPMMVEIVCLVGLVDMYFIIQHKLYIQHMKYKQKIELIMCTLYWPIVRWWLPSVWLSIPNIQLVRQFAL